MAPASHGEGKRLVRDSLAVCMGVAVVLIGGLAGCSAKEPAPQGDDSAAASPTRGAAAAESPDDEGRSPASYFKVGDCFPDPITGATSIALVDCAEPHVGEVYAIFMLPDGPFPGNDSTGYKKQCGAVARTILSPEEAASDPTLTTNIKFPDEKSWAIGDRSVNCIASTDEPRTGSIRH
jgi:hypothetical protein